MPIGFSIVGLGGDIEFRATGWHDDAAPRLVTSYQAPEGGALLMGGLDYREDLLKYLRLHMPPELAPACSSNDAALAFAAHRYLGLNGLARLEGDFSLGIWDARENRLIGMRDPLGGYPLFWIQRYGVTALGTSLRPLLGLLTARSIDRDYIADYLMLPGCGHAEVNGERSIFQGVNRVMAGSIVRLDVQTGDAKRQSYWDWSAGLEDLGSSRLEEVAERYALLLREAVRQRMRRTTASHLSGGWTLPRFP
jgi:asparagine synthase (glutamine-hydrolysing)